jgi:hypothetical protein
MRLREGLNPEFRKRQKELLIMTTTITGKLYQANGGGHNPQVNYYLPTAKEAGKELQQIFASNGIKLSLKQCSELSNLCGIKHINLLNRGWVEQRVPQDAYNEVIKNIVGDSTDVVNCIKNYLA